MKTMFALPQPNDLELLTLAQTGNRDAYGQLVARHQTLVASIAYSICGDFARSEDIAQEAFIRAWRQLTALEDPAKFKAWLCGITRNLALNFNRQQGRRPDWLEETDSVATESAADTPDPHEHAVTREESAIVWQALEKLPEAYREPLILFYREHHSVERVAAALDLSEDTAKQRLSRGRALLRDQVESLVERSLGFTTPGVMFTTAVLGALQVATAQITAATIAGTAAKSGATAKAAGTLPSLLLLATPLLALPIVNIAASLFVGRELLRGCRSPEERKFLKRLWWIEGIASNLAIVVLVGLTWCLRENGSPLLGARADAVVSAGLIGLTLIVPALLYFKNRRRLLDYARNVQLPEHSSRWRKKMFFGPRRALIYRSKLTAFGLPLIDIRFGHAIEQPLARGTAMGWIALGDVAYGGVFALGGFAVGGIAIGGVGIGALSVGYLGVGLVAFGGLVVGGLAKGVFIGIGYIAFGSVLALGWKAAFGIVALARHLASGEIAWAESTRYAVAQDWRETNPIVNTFNLNVVLYVLLPGFLNAVIAMVGSNAFVRDRAPGSRNRFALRPAFLGLLSVAVLALALGFNAAVGRTSHRFAAESETSIARARAAATHATEDEARAKARYELGQQLAKAHQPAAALAEFLWCFDTGMAPLPKLAGNRTVEVLVAIRALGDTYPPAKVALLERRDQAQVAVLAGQGTQAMIGDVVALNRTLREDSRSLALYDRLPPPDKLRPALRRWLFDKFLKAKRYDEAVQAEPSAQIFQRWSSLRSAENRSERSTWLPSIRKMFHDDDMTWITDRLEALAGAGQLDDARSVLALALAYDGSESARIAYRTALNRAGHPELLASKAASVAPTG